MSLSSPATSLASVMRRTRAKVERMSEKEEDLSALMERPREAMGQFRWS